MERMSHYVFIHRETQKSFFFSLLKMKSKDLKYRY